MDFRVTAGEEALVFRLAELLDAGTQPREVQLADELGPAVRQQLAALQGKGWIIASVAADGAVTVVDLTGPAWKAVRSRRDVGR